MNITINDNSTKLPAEIKNLSALAEWKKLPTSGTAVAVNGKVIPRNLWNNTFLEEGDKVIIISAAYGG